MRTKLPARAGLVLAALALFVACGKDEKVPSAQPGTGGSSGAAGSGGRGGSGGSSGSGGSAGMTGTLEPCLDRPTDLPRPPNGKLPCELIPPGVSLPGN